MERLAAHIIAFVCEAAMANPNHFSAEHNKAIRAAVGERLSVILALAGRQRVPRPIRQSLDRLEERELGIKTSPSIVPPQKEGWLRWLSPKRFR
jgi:hypothetical protein